MWRPAWRIIHTGVRSTFSPRAARSSSGSSVADEEVFSASGAAAAIASRLARLVVAQAGRRSASAGLFSTAWCQPLAAVEAQPTERNATASIFNRCVPDD